MRSFRFRYVSWRIPSDCWLVCFICSFPVDGMFGGVSGPNWFEESCTFSCLVELNTCDSFSSVHVCWRVTTPLVADDSKMDVACLLVRHFVQHLNFAFVLSQAWIISEGQFSQCQSRLRSRVASLWFPYHIPGYDAFEA